MFYLKWMFLKPLGSNNCSPSPCPVTMHLSFLHRIKTILHQSVSKLRKLHSSVLKVGSIIEQISIWSRLLLYHAIEMQVIQKSSVVNIIVENLFSIILFVYISKNTMKKLQPWQNTSVNCTGLIQIETLDAILNIS